jgi:hypothetical protein
VSLWIHFWWPTVCSPGEFSNCNQDHWYMVIFSRIMKGGGLPAIFPCLRSQACRRWYRKRMAVLSRAVTGPLLRFIKILSHTKLPFYLLHLPSIPNSFLLLTSHSTPFFTAAGCCCCLDWLLLDVLRHCATHIESFHDDLHKACARRCAGK